MRSSDIYLLQLHIKKCKININETGSVGLLLRAGKNQSHVTEMKPIIKGVINFNTSIKLNIDSSALDTQRCSLTLNFVSAENIRRIIGIVVINLPEIGEQIQKTFKVTSTPDKEAQIELSISVNELDSPTKVKSKQPEKSSLNVSEKGRKFQNQPQRKSGPSQKQRSIGESLLLMTHKSQQNPTSPPSESTEKLNLKSKRSECEMESFVQNEDFIGTIQKLRRQKEMLKELLKLQMQKSHRATNHLKNIIDVLHVAIGINFGHSIQQQSLRNTLPGDSFVLKKEQNFGLSKSNLNQTSVGLRNHHFLDVIKQNRNLQTMNLPGDSTNRSYLSVGNQKPIDFVGILSQLKKKMQENGESKSEMIKLFQKVKLQPQLTHDPQKMRVLKTKIDKSYLSILGKNPVTKEQILKHKIEINKYLDEFITPAGPK